MKIKNLLKKTKIVATIGPASNNKKIIEKMCYYGVDVIRINFSHADHKQVAKEIKIIKKIQKEKNINISTVADLQGPKLRIGDVKTNSFLKKNDELLFINKKIIGNHEQVYLNYKKFTNDVQEGDRILIDDGKIILKCLYKDIKKNTLKARVVQGGELKSKKGVNLPNTNISLPALTKKDIKDLKFAIKNKIDWIALSFVRSKEDLLILKKLIKKYNNNKLLPIIAKIEKPQAIINIKNILKHCDAIMVARGDLGVEMPLEDLPLIQKQLVHEAIENKVPVIIATQMMENMIKNVTPTRAEVNDVANSVLDDSDALMLSAETSIGLHPIEVIKQMTKIICKIENSKKIKSNKLFIYNNKKHKNKTQYITNKMCYIATKLSEKTHAKAIITLTDNGYNTLQISSYRPPSYIIAFTSNPEIIPILNLSHGVKAFMYDINNNTDDIIKHVVEITKKLGYIKTGDYVINMYNKSISGKEESNTIKLLKI